MRRNYLNLSVLLVLGLAVLGAWKAAAQDATEPPRFTPPDQSVVEDVKSKVANKGGEIDYCIECHAVLGSKSEAIVDQFKASVHGDMGFSCADCHGGDKTTMLFKQAMSPEAGFIGKPTRQSIPQVCARCHSNAVFMKQYGGLRTDQLDLYKTSKHGQALFEKNDVNVAVCTDCHSVHSILTATDPKATVYKKNIPGTCGKCHGDAKLMAIYGLDAAIPDKYTHGQHGKKVLEDGDLGAPVCSDCHGNHGALPPGVASIEHVCGQCHLQTEKYYSESKHAAAFAAAGKGRCVVCHNQHALQKPSDNYEDPNADTNCTVCHKKDSPDFKIILRMQENITQIKGMHDKAASLVTETEETTHLSMHDMTPQVEQINTKLVSARAIQHTTSLDKMKTNLDETTAQYKTIVEFTEKLLKRSRFNKQMVTLLAVLLVGYGVLLLYYKKAVLDVVIPWQYYEGKPLEPHE